MRLLIIVLLSSILLLGACFDKRPKGVLPKKQMTTLLTEVHLLDGYLQTLPIDSAKKMIDTLYAQLLFQYDLDSVGFARNINYYYNDPIKTEEIYEKIEQTLNNYQDEFTRQDSIRYAHERDSLQRVSRYQTMLHAQQGLWNFHPDTAYVFEQNEHIRQGYLRMGLLYLWQNANIPMPARPAQPQATPETLRKPVGASPLRHDVEVREDRPVIAPELEVNNVEEQEF